MNIKTVQEAGVTILSISGRLDSISSAEAEVLLKQTVETGAEKIAVDMAEVDYISSAGLRVLLSMAKHISSTGGRMVLYDLQQEVRQVFEISGMPKIITTVKDRNAALSEF